MGDKTEILENPLYEYRLDELDKGQTKVINTAGDLVTKVALLQQKLAMYVVGITMVLNTLIFFGEKMITPKYTETEKKEYYDGRVKESEIVKELRLEIERLQRER